MKTIPLACLLCLTVWHSMARTPDSLDLKIGQMIMIGINDRTSLSANDPLMRELREGMIGGVVLFEKNLTASRTKENLRSLISDLSGESALPLWVSIDEEGGRVHRLREQYGFFSLPSAARLGRIDNPDSTLFYNRKLAALLSELGINLNYAPSVDVAVNPANTVIVRNERSFGAQPATVARHAALCIRAHREYGIRTVLKHFPGHGSSASDSHLGLVDVTRTWQQRELDPYDSLIRAGLCDAVMMAHIVNRRWNTALPATLSYEVATGMLRERLGFNGVVFSDDMQMQAISDHYGMEQAIKMAINAGVDVLMFANTLPAADKRVTATRIHGIIRKLVETKAVPLSRIDESYARVMTLKRRGFRSPARN